ncbi:MAG: hypothetical protein ACXAEX_18820 [Promethearchaeota archaeon]|jgi:hypothetical protein
MESLDLLLGLIFSSEDRIIYEKIKIPKKLSEEDVQYINQLPMRFLGPLFMTLAYDNVKKWNIDFIESTLSSNEEQIIEETFMQSFLCLNSSVYVENNMTFLFSFIGSPYTEDPKMLYEKMSKYIHQSIIQGRFVTQMTYGVEFNYHKFVNGELKRGLNLLYQSLGSPRKMHWEEKKKYYSVGLIERTKIGDIVESYLYTFDTDDNLRIRSLNSIPSYYIMAILPNYFENRIVETLTLFEKREIYPNIRKIKLSSLNSEVLYIEEFIIENQIRKSYGLVLISTNEDFSESYDISFFKKKLRLILDKKKNFEETVIEINSRINPFDKWNIDSEENLRNIKELLDSKN